VDESKEGLSNILVERPPSLKIGRRDEPKEQFRSFGREKTFIGRAIEPEERFRHLSKRTPFFENRK
jgi:hypothetical protein